MTATVVLDVLAGICLIGGATLSLVAAIGLLRFPDVLSRMHAATKPQVLGLVLLLLGVGLRLRNGIDVTTLLLVAAFQLTTAPVAAHMLGRAAYRLGRVDTDLLVADELSDELERLRRHGVEVAPGPSALIEREEGTGEPASLHGEADPDAPAADPFGPAGPGERPITLDGTLADPIGGDEDV